MLWAEACVSYLRYVQFFFALTRFVHHRVKAVVFVLRDVLHPGVIDMPPLRDEGVHAWQLGD